MGRAIWIVLLLAGCGMSPVDLTATVGGVTAGSIAVIHRTPFDAVWSILSGKDCSVVRLDQGKTYCRPVEPPPASPPYCTRSLGVVDCWADPSKVPGIGPNVADGPRTPNPQQEADRTRGWP